METLSERKDKGTIEKLASTLEPHCFSCGSCQTKETFHEDIESVYHHFSQRFPGMLVRQRDWWLENVIDDLQVAVYYDIEQQPKGYILYGVKNEGGRIFPFKS